MASVPDALPAVQQPDAQGATADPVSRPMLKTDRLAKTEHNISEQNTYTDQSVIQNEDEFPATDDKIDNGEKEETKLVKDANAGQKKQALETEEPRNNRPRRPSSRDKYHIPTEKKSSQKGTWSMGFAVGNSGGASTEVGGGTQYLSRVSMAAVSNGLMNIPEDKTLVFEDGIPYLRQAKQVIDIKHHQPISVGVSVRKSLGKGFSVESGLTYTLLSSDVKLADGNQEVEQKLHYVGIPLRANWNFLDKKLVTLYVSGGGMIEKCVYGKLGSEKETVKPLQFSVSGAVGVQLNATKRIGIYMEPGVAYFFDDGSSVQTIRKENPFNFNIQAGIRFTY